MYLDAMPCIFSACAWKAWLNKFTPDILNYLVWGLDVNAAAVVLEDKMVPICRNFAR